MKRCAITVVLASLLLVAGCKEEVLDLPDPPAGEFALGNETNEVAGATTLTPNGDILIVGAQENPDDGNYDLLIMAVSQRGELITSHRHGQPAYAEAGWAIAPLPSGEFIVFGTRNSPGSVNSQFQLTLLDSQYNVRWQTLTVPSTPFDNPTAESAQIFVLADGTFFVSATNRTGCVLMHFSDDGQLLELRPSVSTQDANPRCKNFCRLANGGFARISTNYIIPDAFEVSFFDSIGTLQSTISYSSGSNDNMNAQTLVEMRDGRLMGCVSNLYGSGSWVTVVDPVQNTFEVFTRSDPNFSCSGIQLPDGRVLWVGHDGIPEYSQGSSDRDGRIELRDSSGPRIAATSFGGDKADALKQGLLLPDGRVLLLGETLSYGHGGSDIYLVFYQP